MKYELASADIFSSYYSVKNMRHGVRARGTDGARGEQDTLNVPRIAHVVSSLLY